MSTPQEQAITESVRSLYEEYPFPAPVSSARPAALEGWCNYTYLYYRTMNEWRDCRERRILDAGCGTGETLWPAFINNPGAHIVGYDLSQASLDLAREKLDAIGGSGIRLEQRDLNDLPAPARPFDLIFCTGVLHHLADPLRGVRNLVAALQPDGIMVLMLYATHVRAEIKKVQRILSLLGGGDPLPRRVEMARRFFASLPPGHVLRNPNRIGVDLAAYVERDEHLIDTFFHPRELTLTMGEVFDFLDAAGLELIRFLDERPFDLRRLLHDPDIVRRAMFMSRRQKYELADLIDPRGDYQFIVRHRGWRPKDRPPRASTASLVPVASPVAVLVDRTPLASAPLMPRQAMVEVAGFVQERYRLDDETRAVLEQCDGTRTAGEIAEGREGILDLLAALEERDVIFWRGGDSSRERPPQAAAPAG